MKNLRIIALVLAVIMVLGVLASCTDSTDGESTHTRPVGDDSSDEGTFASADYAGEDFTVLYIEQCREYYGGEYIDADTLTGETINDAVYARNLAVEEKYNVNIVERAEEGAPATTLQQFYMAGDFCFDLIYGWCYKLGMCITNNFFMDFYDLPTCDFTQEYWSPSSIENMVVNDHLYIACPDISMNKIQWTNLIFFNKNLYEDYNLESEFGSLYDMVDNGTWTLDKYFAIGQSVSNDVNGDGKYDREDVVGFGLDGGSWTYLSCGIKLTEPDANGVPMLSFYSEKLLDIINKVNAAYSDEYQIDGEESQVDGPGMYDDIFKYQRSIFSTDHCLFMPGTPQETGEFRNMKSDYGILPLPKYDDHQEKYYSDIDYNAAMFALPMTMNQVASNASIERTSNVMEYWAYKSSELLLPVYYDTLIKGQRLAGDDDSRMLDIIRDACVIQLTRAAGIYYDDGGNDSLINTLNSMYKKPNSATSTYKRQEKKLQKTIDDFYAELIQMDAKNMKNTEVGAD